MKSNEKIIWISTSDRLPPNITVETFLVCLENKYVTEANYSGHGRFFKLGFDKFPSRENKVTHWCKMPKSPNN